MSVISRGVRAALAAAALIGTSVTTTLAAELFVAPGGTGSGTSAAPFGRIQDALNAARAGDVITVAAGTYAELLRTVRSGTATARITVRASGARGSVIVSVKGRVLTVAHAFITVEGLVLDGQYGADDLVRVSAEGDGFTLRNSEVRRSTYDAVDLGGADDVLFEGDLIHHALNAAGGRTDAHGIVAGPVHRLTIRNTEIHTFSGDAIQVDPGRSAPGWSDVTVEGCKLWLGPLASPENGFAAGAVPGENAIDTKSGSGLPRSKITIRDTQAWGFRQGLITNMAAFNLKENVDAVVDGVTVRDSEIAFRLRGPSSAQPAGAWVRVQNAVIYNTTTAFRYEDNIANLRIWNSTIGAGVSRAFQAASSTADGLDVRNLLVLAASLPREAAGASNLAVGSSAFVDTAANNYQLSASSPAVDAGTAIPEVTRDRQNTPRPQGRGPDIGAYERVVSAAAASDVVLNAATGAAIVGDWHVESDSSAAGGMLVANPDNGFALASPMASPPTYFELTFQAEAGRAYRLWIRGRAEMDRPSNDAAFVQFSDSVNAEGSSVYRAGTTSALTVSLQDCSTCSLSGWGWQDDASGLGVLGPLVYFAKTGTHTVRIQPREDGLSIDQIVLSSSAYLTVAPGAPRNDSTILTETGL